MIEEIASDYLIQYGYFFIFLATAMENIPFVGIFLPGEVVVVAAGFFAATGELDISLVFLVAAFGGIVGNNIGYWVGRYGGRPLIEGLADRFHIDSRHVKSAEAYFDSHGSKTVFIGRYMAGLKALVTTLAGAAHMNYGVFLLYSSAGIISWTIIALILGFFFGQYFDAVLSVLQTVGWVLPVLMIIILIAFLIIRRRNKRNND